MKFRFRGRPITRERLGWWLRIALTKIFGTEVAVEGRTEKVKILAWIWKGEIMLMGAERSHLKAYFLNQYTLRLRESELVSCSDSPAPAEKSGSSLAVVVLGHQKPGTIEKLLERFQRLGPGYRVLLAYGGDRQDFANVAFTDKVFIESPALRGPSNLMNHYELIERPFEFYSQRGDLPEFVALLESDLVALRTGYLDEAIQLMNRHAADFGGSDIRDVTNGSNPFLTRSIALGEIGPNAPEETLRSRRYLHGVGCFTIIRTSLIPAMLRECERMKNLYFEVMFPTAALAVGGRILSFQTVSKIVDHIRYAPRFSIDEVRKLKQENAVMVHPVKGDDLVRALELES